MALNLTLYLPWYAKYCSYIWALRYVLRYYKAPSAEEVTEHLLQYVKLRPTKVRKPLSDGDDL